MSTFRIRSLYALNKAIFSLISLFVALESDFSIKYGPPPSEWDNPDEIKPDEDDDDIEWDQEQDDEA